MQPERGQVWSVRLLGGFDVNLRAGEQAKFRSKSCRSLLAFLLLHPSKEVSRFLLEATLWPESDSTRQAQNLRRAIADLRDVIEGDGERGTTIVTRRDVVACRTDLVNLDTIRFLQLSERGLRGDDTDALAEAVVEYRGALLDSIDDEWVYPFRLDFEERFGQCVDRLCAARCEAGLPKEAVRIARSAVLLAPNREDIQIALIRSYRQAGLETEALRQFEDLERMLDEVWGEPPSEAAREALEGRIKLGRTAQPTTRGFHSDPEPAGGAMSVASKFYVRRPADALAEKCLDRGESVILIQGPRQVGKSSLLARSLDYARSQGQTTVLIDFQTMGSSQMADEERFYKALAYSVASQLKVALDLPMLWSSWLGPNMNLDVVLGKLLENVDGHVCWAIDEADHLFGRPYANDFFGLLRSWHNRRALDPAGPWGKLTLVLAYATEVHLFITDLNQSPFNVGVHLPLRDFSSSEVAELAACFSIDSKEAVDGVYRATNGHPFLVRRALTFISQGGTLDDLEATCSLPDGPFGDHLQQVLGVILHDPDLVEGIKKIHSGEPFTKPMTRYRLITAGILLPTPDSQVQFRVPGYGPFLASAFG